MLTVFTFILFGISMIFILPLIFRVSNIIYLKYKGLDKSFTYVKDDLLDTKERNFTEYVTETIHYFIFVVIVTIISIPIFYNFIKIDNNKQNYLEEVEYAELYSLKDNITVIGRSPMLGSGHVDGKLYYFYTTKYKDGFIQDKLYASECYIIESNNEKPRIVETRIKDKEYWYVKLFHCDIIPENKYKIIIPKNSITRDFKIDNE